MYNYDTTSCTKLDIDKNDDGAIGLGCISNTWYMSAFLTQFDNLIRVEDIL